MTELALPDSGLVTSATGLRLRNESVSPSIAEWSEFGRQLGVGANRVSWLIGDWMALGERVYGSTYAEGQKITGLAYQTLMQLAWVCKSVESSRRREDLSFSHHVEVAGLAPWAQDQWLGLAEREGLSTRELRARIQGDHELPEAAPARLRLTAAPERAERWKAAAERAGVGFDEWAANALDRAAA
ncbi:MAG: LmbU family transcriptional regulator [Gaiellaceae bacterium]